MMQIGREKDQVSWFKLTTTNQQPATTWVFPKIGIRDTPSNMDGLSWENPIKMDDLRGFKNALFSETSTSTERCCLTFLFLGGENGGIQASLSQVLHQYLDGPSPRFGGICQSMSVTRDKGCLKEDL